jgi:nucleoside-diphosphate-sugar epimerase
VIAVTRSAGRSAEFRQAGLTPFVADIQHPETLADLPEADRVLWSIGFDRTPGQSQEQVFVEGLRNVLARMQDRCRRFLYVSSTSVYGQNDGSWVDESSPCEPAQPGGVNCLAGERLVADAPGENVIFRLAGIYGPGRLLSRVADLQAGMPLPGDPEAWLNLIHVDDAANAVVHIAAHPAASGAVLVADDRPVERGEYYTRLALLRRRASMRRSPAPAVPVG